MTLFGRQVTVDENIAAEIGITGVSTLQLNWGVPNVAWQGYSGIGSNGLTQGNVLHNYQFTDDLTWIQGAATRSRPATISARRASCWTATTARAAALRSTRATPRAEPAQPEIRLLVPATASPTSCSAIPPI